MDRVRLRTACEELSRIVQRYIVNFREIDPMGGSISLGRRPNCFLGLSLNDRTIILILTSDIIAKDSLSRMRESVHWDARLLSVYLSVDPRSIYLSVFHLRPSPLGSQTLPQSVKCRSVGRPSQSG